MVAAHGCSCPTACGIFVPQPGLEPAPPELKGGPLTTGPPEKSLYLLSMNETNLSHHHFFYYYFHCFIIFHVTKAPLIFSFTLLKLF